MISLCSLCDEEVRYICDVIPAVDVQEYLKHNPKEFAKLKPGFRPTSIKSTQTSRLLYDYRAKHFISSFIEKHIDVWLKSINENIQACIKNGDTEYAAYIHTFPESFFKDNLPLFFKLNNQEINPEILSVLSEIVSMEKGSRKKDEELKFYKQLEENESEYKRTIKEKNLENKKLKSDNSNKNNQIERLSSKVSSLEKSILELNEAIREKNQNESKLREKLIESENKIEKIDKERKELIEENRELLSLNGQYAGNCKELKNQVNELLTQLSVNNYKIMGNANTIRPLQMDQFDEFIKYNFEDIGLDVSRIEINLLIDYINTIMFEGKPILINALAAHTIAKCVSNCLVGGSNYDSKPWTSDLTSKDLIEFLNTSGRVVCLDGFIGNCDELQLFNILGCYKSKIIIVSISYEHTLSFLPEEILSQGIYINVSRIPEFQIEHCVNEDPAVLEEASYELNLPTPNGRIKNITNQILQELLFSTQTINSFCAYAYEEKKLSELLLFSILPFVRDVRQENPYLLSPRLEKYAGPSGRSQVKETLVGWYGNE